MKKYDFYSKVFPEPNTGCWIWSHPTAKGGYGKFKALSEQLAHRYSYLIHKGEFDRKLCVLHKCDTPACVNPDHLFLGTQADNNLDRDRKGRQKTKRGTDHKLAKLTEEQVIEIRRIYKPRITPTRALAKKYGVSQRKIMHILHRESWAHI